MYHTSSSESRPDIPLTGQARAFDEVNNVGSIDMVAATFKRKRMTTVASHFKLIAVGRAKVYEGAINHRFVI